MLLVNVYAEEFVRRASKLHLMDNLFLSYRNTFIYLILKAMILKVMIWSCWNC